MRKIFFLLAIVFIFVGCSSSKKAAEEHARIEREQFVADSIAKVRQDSIMLAQTRKPVEKPKPKVKPFNTYTSKISGSYKSLPFSGTVRMVYDSIIWVSVTEMGVEAVRAKFTKDSMFMIDKINKEFVAIPYSRASSFIGIPVNFQFAQNLFVDTTQMQKLSGKNLAGTITKKNMKIDNKIFLPIEIELNALLGTKEQKVKLKVKNHKLNTTLEFPFERPSNYKVRH